jgi:DNA mismatch endonuclease (patch repair protein)
MSWASSEGVRRSMRSNRGRDTQLELAVRRGLHARGLRYRVQFKVPGSSRRTIDVAFTRLRLAIFIDGCFWHGCPVHHTLSKTHPDFWAEKVNRNRERDVETDLLLTDQGWTVRRFWEHESVDAITDAVVALVQARRHLSSPTGEGGGDG